MLSETFLCDRADIIICRHGISEIGFIKFTQESVNLFRQKNRYPQYERLPACLCIVSMIRLTLLFDSFLQYLTHHVAVAVSLKTNGDLGKTS